MRPISSPRVLSLKIVCSSGRKRGEVDGEGEVCVCGGIILSEGGLFTSRRDSRILVIHSAIFISKLLIVKVCVKHMNECNLLNRNVYADHIIEE